MQQDNDAKHERKSTGLWFKQKKICLREQLSQSPDLNLTEMLCQDFKRAIPTRHPKIIAQLKQFVKSNGPEFLLTVVQVWSATTGNVNETVEVIAAKGG